MTKIELVPLEGDSTHPIPVPKSSQAQVIGRGPFLQITDKKVSRNHATLEIGDGGKLILTPIHTNPCFFQEKGQGEKKILPKSVPQVLEDKDVFGLLPDKLFYRVVYDNLVANEQDEEKTDHEKKGSEVVKKEDEHDKDSGDKKVSNADHMLKMAMPLDKKRTLPKWMVGSSKRMGKVVQAESPPPSPPKKKARVAKVPSKVPPVPKAAAGRGRGRPKKVKEEISDEEVVKPRPRGRQARGNRGNSTDGAEKTPTRRPRAASQKKPQYQEDSFLESESEEDWESEQSSDEGWSPHKKRGHDDDSDFNISEDSGSDWEETHKGGGKRRSSTSTKNVRRSGTRRGKPRGAKNKRRKADSDFDDFDDDEDEYVPRPSKSRGGTQKKKSKTYDESDDDDEPPKKRRAARKGRKKYSEDVEDSESSFSEESSKGMRQSCMYGKKCYRKNPGHFKQFCHPGDSSYEEEEEEEEEYKKEKKKTSVKRGRGRPKKDPPPAREKDKKSVLHGASDDDGGANTYDYGDSFIDDGSQSLAKNGTTMECSGEDDNSDSELEDSEDIKEMAKEAKSFVKNKKLQQPTSK